MIKIEKTTMHGWKEAIMGMRNPMNSWDISDSFDMNAIPFNKIDSIDESMIAYTPLSDRIVIGENDYNLMLKLAKAGSVHAKYRRMIIVYCDITAPLYWWKEFDTYKVGTVANSCSTIHKIHAKEFTIDDFSHEHLDIRTIEHMNSTIKILNDYRNLYVNYNPDEFEIKGCPSKKLLWWQMIQLLPSSYNQKRTVMMNYEVLSHIYHDRKNHKLDEWIDLCGWIKELPYSKIITLEER